MNQLHHKILFIIAVSIILTGCSGFKNTSSPDIQNTLSSNSITGMGTLESDGKNDSFLNDQTLPQTSAEKKNDNNKKLVKTANLEVELVDFDKDIEKIEKEISIVNGYIESLNISGNSIHNMNEERQSNISVKIPSDKFDLFLEKMNGIGNIRYQSENTTDITLQYTDIEDHLRVIKQEQETLIRLLDQAKDIESMLQIESKLSDIRYQIETYMSQIKNYDNQVSYSSINLLLKEVKTYSTQEKDGVFVRITTGFKSNLIFVKTCIVNGFVFLISSIPILLLSGLIFIIASQAIEMIKKWIIKQKNKKIKK